MRRRRMCVSGIVALAIAAAATTATATAGETARASATPAELAKAKNDFKKWQAPTKFTLTQKVGKAIPTGKKIDIVTCAPAACLIQPSKVKEAAALLGWSVKTIIAGTDPQSQQNAVAQMIRDKPDAAMFVGIDSSVFQRQLADLRKQKVPIVAFQTTDKQDPPGFFVIPGRSVYTLSNNMLAAAAVASTNGDANVLIVNVPAFPIYRDVIAPGIKAAMKRYCATCEVSTYDMPVTSLGKDHSARIVNHLRANPEINAVINLQDVTSLGTFAAMKAAGIAGRVQQFGLYPTAANLANVATGQEVAIVPNPYEEMAYLAIDAVARIMVGQSPQIDISATAPEVIWTKANLPSTSKIPPITTNIASVFKKLWGK